MLSSPGSAILIHPGRWVDGWVGGFSSSPFFLLVFHREKGHSTHPPTHSYTDEAVLERDYELIHTLDLFLVKELEEGEGGKEEEVVERRQRSRTRSSSIVQEMDALLLSASPPVR